SADWVRLVQARDLTILGAHLTTVAEREASAARWTFQQEASLFLDFLRRGRLRVDDLVTWAARPDECNAVYGHPRLGPPPPGPFKADRDRLSVETRAGRINDLQHGGSGRAGTRAHLLACPDAGAKTGDVDRAVEARHRRAWIDRAGARAPG